MALWEAQGVHCEGGTVQSWKCSPGVSLSWPVPRRVGASPRHSFQTQSACPALIVLGCFPSAWTVFGSMLG